MVSRKDDDDLGIDHIAFHRHYMGNDQRRYIPWEEAVASWGDTVYRPMVQTIRESGILEDFPGRTETDLYLFTMDHLHHLRQRYGEASTPSRAIRHFRLSRRHDRWRALLERVKAWGKRVRGG